MDMTTVKFRPAPPPDATFTARCEVCDANTPHKVRWELDVHGFLPEEFCDDPPESTGYSLPVVRFGCLSCRRETSFLLQEFPCP
jgi:hypothetical protein